MVIVNVGHPEGNDELEQVLGRTMAAVFPHGAARPDRGRRTRCWSASEAPTSAARLRARRRGLPAELRTLALIEAARLEPRLPGGEVYTDDHAPVEWLIDSSILEYAASDYGGGIEPALDQSRARG